MAIVSIMGAYRTGKSFLLDLFLRYLRYMERSSHPHEGSSVDFRSSDGIPEWLVADGAKVTEGLGEKCDRNGFQWRGGMEKCTQGVWIWSHPFMISRPTEDNPEISEKVAVLLLDSQGAFDSQMTKDQSATVFGLTAVLSSLQIYNLSMQIQEDKIESLHYFMECAMSCMRFLATDSEETKSTNSNHLFQELQFLVRDWANFEPTWSLGECEKQMRAHLAQHLDTARDSTTPDALKSMFDKIGCWMLPHPGLKINKTNWTGDIADLDPEFIKFLDVYVRRTFGTGLGDRKILGKPLTPSSFADVMEMFTLAFQNLVPKGANLALAIANSSNLMSKEKAISDFKRQIELNILEEASSGIPESEFAKLETNVRKTVIDHFIKSTTFGPPEARDSVKDELVAELNSLREFYEAENRRRMESALTVFAGFSVLIGVLYFLDKLSDVTCDWYSETCVKVSNALFFIYFTMFVAILTNAYFLLQSKGKTVTVMALIELGKASFALFLGYASTLKSMIGDIRNSNTEALGREASSLLHRFIADLKNGYTALTRTFQGSKKEGKEDARSPE